MSKLSYSRYPIITIRTGPNLVIIKRVPKFSLFRLVISLDTIFIFPKIPSFIINTRFIKLPVAPKSTVTVAN
jgi:hypothetical protein